MSRKFDIHDLRNAETLDDLEEAYDGLGPEYESEVNRYGWLEPRLAAEKAATLISAKARVLDAGAGSGLIGQALNKLGFQTIDGTAAAIEEAMREVARGEMQALIE